MPPLSIRWLLVDEAQDMDEVQLEWVKAHGSRGVEITLVGDDDQSLYTFRQQRSITWAETHIGSPVGDDVAAPSGLPVR